MRRAELRAEPDGSSDRAVAHLRAEAEGKTSGEASCRKSSAECRNSKTQRLAGFVWNAPLVAFLNLQL